MASGDPFTFDQRQRLEAALAAAQRQTGLRFAIRVGSLEARTRDHAERLLARLVGDPKVDAAVLLAVSPGQRVLEIVTTRAARFRLADSACGLASLTMTASFGVGDLTGGIVAGLRMLADAAGRGESPQPDSPAGPAALTAGH